MICKHSAKEVVVANMALPRLGVVVLLLLLIMIENVTSSPSSRPMGKRCFQDTGRTRCFLEVTSSKSWHDARKHCQSLGADLAKMDKSAHDEIENRLSDTNHWIGLNDLRTSRTFLWVDKTNLTWTNWKVNRPAHGEDEDCVRMHRHRTWGDKKCEEEYEFICEWFPEKLRAEGNTIFVSFPKHSFPNNYDYELLVSIGTMRAVETTEMTVSGVSMTADSARINLIPLVSSISILRNVIFKVSSTKNVAVVVTWGNNRAGASYLALPEEALRENANEYFVFSGIGAAWDYSNWVEIGALHPSTTVTLTAPSHWTAISEFTGSKQITISGKWTMISAKDLNGIRISADNSIIVTSGGYKGGSQYTAVMTEQMLPSSMWGSEFVVPPIPPLSANLAVQVRVMGRTALSKVQVAGQEVTLQGSGMTHQVKANISEPVYISSDQPVAVMLYVTLDASKDSCMLTIVPRSQWPWSVRVFHRMGATLLITTRRIHKEDVIHEESSEKVGSWVEHVASDGFTDIFSKVSVTTSDLMTFTCRNHVDNSYCRLMVYVILKASNRLNCVPAGMQTKEMVFPDPVLPTEASSVASSTELTAYSQSPVSPSASSSRPSDSSVQSEVTVTLTQGMTSPYGSTSTGTPEISTETELRVSGASLSASQGDSSTSVSAPPSHTELSMSGTVQLQSSTEITTFPATEELTTPGGAASSSYAVSVHTTPSDTGVSPSLAEAVSSTAGAANTAVPSSNTEVGVSGTIQLPNVTGLQTSQVITTLPATDGLTTNGLVASILAASVHAMSSDTEGGTSLTEAGTSSIGAMSSTAETTSIGVPPNQAAVSASATVPLPSSTEVQPTQDTSTVPATEVSTMSGGAAASISPPAPCQCSWTCKKTKKEQVTVKERATEEAKKVQKELTVEKKRLSASARKKSSATDERKSSSTMGSVAIAIGVIVLLVIVLPDMMSLTSLVWKKLRQ